MNRHSGHHNRTIRVAFGSPWKTIHPGLQHTLVGDLVLSNQFEALIGMNEFGVNIPLGAKSWEASEDFKTFTFHIDTSRTYSDGGHLSAKDYKRSWEEALALEPSSNNSSLLDIMYKIKGFQDFHCTKTLSGIEAPDDATLRVQFESPFRMSLAHFQGNRFSAYRETGGKFLGTGQFVIFERNDHVLELTPNPYSVEAHALHSLTISLIKSEEAVNRLLDGTIDVFAYGRGSTISPLVREKKNLSVIVGQDALHETLILNLMPGRFFENRKYRLAMQYLIHKHLALNPKLLGNPDYSSVDPQVFLPLQNGRVDALETRKIVESGQEYVNELIAASKRKPLIVYLSEGDDWVMPFLKQNGISVSHESKKVSPQERINIVYKSYEPDLIVTAFGVASGDPDGIYHRLGRSGAIMTPMSYDQKVADLLEEGRKLTRQEHLDSFYKSVSRAILSEVPIVHLGYSKAIAIYRNDIVQFDSRLLRRNEGHLYGFRFK